MAIPHLLQWALGHLPTLDTLGSVQRYELGDESGRDGGFGELPQEG
jgi:hypothetical protein